MNKLGDLLKDTREDCKVSIQELANTINVSRMTIARLEENKTKLISLNMIIKISNILDIDLCRIVKAYGKRLLKMDMQNVLIACKTISYKGEIIDKIKLEKLIENNIVNLK